MRARGWGMLMVVAAAACGSAACAAILGIGDLPASASDGGADATTADGAMDGAGDSQRQDSSLDGPEDGGPSCDADSLTDPANCGYCGHDCLGGGCDAGLCSPIVLKAYGGNTVAAIAADDQAAYYTYLVNGQPGILNRCDLDGGVVTQIDQAGNTGSGGYGLAIDSQYAYWTDYSAGELRKAPLNGDGGVVLIKPNMLGHHVTLDAQKVYWVSSYYGGVIQRINKDGTSPETLRASSNDYDLVHLAVDSKNLYYGHIRFADGEDAGEVYRIDLNSLMATSLATGQLVSDSIAIDSNNVYWPTRGSQDAGYKDGTIMMVSKYDGGAPNVLASGQASPQGLVVDASYIYWVNFDDGTVHRCDVPTCANAKTIATGQTGAGWLAQSPKRLFWSTYTAGVNAALVTVAK